MSFVAGHGSIAPLVFGKIGKDVVSVHRFGSFVGLELRKADSSALIVSSIVMASRPRSGQVMIDAARSGVVGAGTGEGSAAASPSSSSGGALAAPARNGPLDGRDYVVYIHDMKVATQ
jgi:hypothetical protein